MFFMNGSNLSSVRYFTVSEYDGLSGEMRPALTGPLLRSVSLDYM